MIRNTQLIEKKDNSDGTHLAVNSIFYTIQGEGPFAGTPAVFVRLAGCNLQCPLCDTEYTYRMHFAVPVIVNRIESELGLNKAYFTSEELVVITGGEPLRQNIVPLVKILLTRGFIVQIETNGTLYRELPFEHENLFIVCSPKTGSIHKKLVPHINAFKYVATVASLRDSQDGLPSVALEHPNSAILARPTRKYGAEIYLQPVDEQNKINNKANQDFVVKSCMKYGYRLCLQTHKLVGVS